MTVNPKMATANLKTTTVSLKMATPNLLKLSLSRWRPPTYRRRPSLTLKMATANLKLSLSRCRPPLSWWQPSVYIPKMGQRCRAEQEKADLALCQTEEQLVRETKKTQLRYCWSFPTCGESTSESPTSAAAGATGVRATKAEAVSAGTGTYSPVIPEPRLRSAVPHAGVTCLCPVTFSSYSHLCLSTTLRSAHVEWSTV